MARNQKYYDPKDRIRILREFERSGLGVMEFCERSGIAYDTLRLWRNKQARGESLENKKKQGPIDPQKRIQAVEAFQRSGMSAKDFAKTWGVGEASLNRWRKLYEEQGPKSLESPSLNANPKKRGPKGLPRALKNEIAQVKRENPTFGLRKMKGFLNRFRGVDASTGAIKRTIEEENLVTPVPRRRRRRSSAKVRRFEMERPMQLWQTDITSFTLTKHQIKCYLVVFMDDRSRYIVGWNVGTKQTGEFVIEALLMGIQRFGRPEAVLSDQGRQYFSWKGKSEFQKLLKKQGIHHSVARSHHPQTVGKCERFWKTMKDELLERVGALDLDEARERLAHFINHYNHFRPNQGIDNLVPADRFYGDESEIRKAIERAMDENELLLATGEKPKTPVYIVGQIDGKPISLHGERGKIVLNMPGADPMGIECKSLEHVTNGGIDEGQRDRSDGREGETAPGQEAQHEAAAEICSASEDALAARIAGAEAESADGGRYNPGVLDGPNLEDPGGEAAEYPAAADLAAVTAGDIGYAGRATGATEDARQRSTDEPERGSESIAEEDQAARGDDPPAGDADPGAAHDAGVSGCDDTDGTGGEECNDPDTDRNSQ
jgi:transposase InsO family protein